MTSKADESSMGTEIAPYSGRIDDVKPIGRVRHDASYVAQLIAAAAGLPQMPRRRRMERWQAVVAYAATDATPQSPHLVKRSA